MATTGVKIRLGEAVNEELVNGKTLPITVTISGKVSYSHIKTRIEGEELVKANERKVSRGGIPDDKPHYLLSISEAQLMPGQDIGPKLQQYILQNISHKLQDNGTYNNVYYAKSKSPFPPAVTCVQNGQSTTLADGRDKVLEGELANGLPVIVGMQVYQSKKQMNPGISLEWVVVNGPVSYFTGGGNAARSASMAETLAMLGATGTAPAETPAPAPAAAGTVPAPAQAAPQYQPAQDTQPVTASPMVAYTGTQANVPFMNVPEGDPAYAAPQGQPQTAYQPQGQYQQPNIQPQGQPNAQPLKYVMR